jgi:hypothetical protein
MVMVIHHGAHCRVVLHTKNQLGAVMLHSDVKKQTQRNR